MIVDPDQLCLRALKEAAARFDAAEQAQEVDEAALAIAITEAAMWVGALDELWGGKGEKVDLEYRGRRDGDDEGLVIPGLRWARNRGIHQVTTVHSTIPRRSYPKRYPMRFRSVMWREFDEVHTTDDRPDRAGEASYREHLAGVQVWVTIRAARGFLARTAAT